VFIAVPKQWLPPNFFCAFIAQILCPETARIFGISKKHFDYHI
jgi:hypothetical protein